MTTLRLAIVGTGSRGMTYGREGVLSGEAVVTAVAEPREDRRRAAAVAGPRGECEGAFKPTSSRPAKHRPGW